MAAAPHAPPSTTPAEVEIQNQQQNDRDQIEEVDMISTSPNQPDQQVVQDTNNQRIESKSQPIKPPEVARNDPQENKIKNGRPVEQNDNPGAEEDDDPRNSLEDFDWDEFDTRYRHAMSEANAKEQGLREKFEQLVEYFGVWATAAAQYDNDRSLKRIKTRRLYVEHAEQSLEQKKIHYTKVVEAFKNALELLGNS